MRVILFWGFVIDRSKPGRPPPEPRSAMLLFGSMIFISGEQSTISLVKCVLSVLNIKKYDVLNCNKNNPRSTYKELFKRLIGPFYLPLLILISLLLILTSKENLKYNKNKYLVFFIGFVIIVLSESSLGYITNNLVKNISISLLPIFLLSITYLIFIYKLKLFNSKI